MPRDPFDEFRKIEKLIQELLRRRTAGGGPSGSVFIRKVGNRKKIDVRGNIPESAVRKLRRKHPDAKISVGEKRSLEPGEVSEKKPKKPRKKKKAEKDSKETQPERLALERFREKKRREGKGRGGSEDGTPSI